MDKKRESEIVADIALFWKDQEMKLNLKDGKGREHSKRKEKLRNQLNHSGKYANLLLKDWLSWWGRMEREAMATRRQDQQDRAKLRQRTFKDIIQPNLLLTGWRGWWSRMEAESKREGSSMKHDEGWAKSRSLTNKIKKQDFLVKYFKPTSMRERGHLFCSDIIVHTTIAVCGNNSQLTLKTNGMTVWSWPPYSPLL